MIFKIFRWKDMKASEESTDQSLKTIGAYLQIEMRPSLLHVDLTFHHQCGKACWPSRFLQTEVKNQPKNYGPTNKIWFIKVSHLWLNFNHWIPSISANFSCSPLTNIFILIALFSLYIIYYFFKVTWRIPSYSHSWDFSQWLDSVNHRNWNAAFYF